MLIIEQGDGDPLVVVPGIQGRWEYQRAAIDALARSFRVLTFSLADEPSAQVNDSSGHKAADNASIHGHDALDVYVAQITHALDQAGIARAVICGVSFGGVVALRFAARFPERTSALILVSTPGPGWRLRPRHEIYARRPLVYGPLFLMETPFRVRREIVFAIPSREARLQFTLTQLRTLTRAPLSLSRIATRGRLLGAGNRVDECAAITAPTLIIHGDPRLDHVVDVAGTSEYARLITGARVMMLERTGHLGCITRPEVFADLVRAFVTAAGPERSRGTESNHAA